MPLTIAIVESDSGELRATVTRPELERLVRRGCPDHPKEACGCAVLDRPAPPAKPRPDEEPAEQEAEQPVAAG